MGVHDSVKLNGIMCKHFSAPLTSYCTNMLRRPVGLVAVIPGAMNAMKATNASCGCPRSSEGHEGDEGYEEGQDGPTSEGIGEAQGDLFLLIS